MCDADEIQKCLNCTRPRCNNCLENAPSKRSQRSVLRIDPETGETTAAYRSFKEAARQNNLNPDHIGRAVRKPHKLVGGYKWKIYLTE